MCGGMGGLSPVSQGGTVTWMSLIIGKKAFHLIIPIMKVDHCVKPWNLLIRQRANEAPLLLQLLCETSGGLTKDTETADSCWMSGLSSQMPLVRHWIASSSLRLQPNTKNSSNLWSLVVQWDDFILKRMKQREPPSIVTSPFELQINTPLI